LLVGPLVMGLVLMVDPWAKHVDWSGGAALELRGGLAPPTPSRASVPTLRLTLAPQATMTYQDRVRGRQLSLDYTPQLVFSVFEGKAELSAIPYRPLLFHQATLRYAGDFNRRWSWQGSAGGSIGQQDYSLQSGGLVQGDGTTNTTAPAQGTLVDDFIITTGGVAAGVGLTGQLTPLHSLSLGPTVTVQRRIDGDDAAAGTVSLDQTSYALDVSHAWLASRVDTVGSALAGGYADFGPINGSQAFGSAELSWGRRLRPRLDSQVQGGVFFTQQVRARQTQSGQTSTTDVQVVPFMPIGNLGLTGRLLERSRLRIASDVNVGSRAYFDPVQGSVLPLVGGGASFDFSLPPDLTVGLAATFYTPGTRPTDSEYRNAATPATSRTVLTVRTPVSYRIDRHWTVEAGTLVTARGPNLRTGIPRLDLIPAPETIATIDLDDIVFDPWRFTQTEFWLYVAFRVRYTTARDGG
jgi:hypothetical protein